MDDRYVAGLFDGEGYVRIARWAKPNSIHLRHAVYAGIGMTYCPIIEAISREFGGYVYSNRHDLRNPNSRIQFVWSVGSQIAAAFLRRIQPHTIVKRDEIDIAITLQDHIDQNPYISAGRNHMHERKGREELLAYREDLFHRITALKKRSFPPLPITGRRPRASMKCV